MMRYLLPLMLVLATGWAGNPISESVIPQPLQEISDDYRLPQDIVPTNYVIELTPYLDTNDSKKFTFDGTSTIDLKIKKNTKTITFHANELNITDISLEYKTNETNTETINNIFKIIDKQKDFVILILNEELQSTFKDVKLTLNFTGVLNDNLRGFYRSSYQDGKEKRWLATTHFEPVAARQAFPCWDEPALKATFNIIINLTSKNYHALSNMLEDKSTNGKTIFLQTQKMSTYLVAFVVSDYKEKGNTEGNFRVWTRPNAIKSTDFAFEIGQQTLKTLDKFTGINYYKENTTGIKMDQISIPDFSAGAMENWGLVTYRESGLLYTEGKSTTQNKQSVATVIAHEFAHQWFGNLVTCDWWDYIWLNEGFATFFEYYATEQIVQTLYNESWRLMDQFVIKNLQASAFVVDATNKTRALNSEVNAKTPAQISSLFDDIAYKKGGSILRMLQQFLTEDLFQKGLNNYLTTNQFKSARPYQLFDAIQKADNKGIIKTILPNNTLLIDVMNNWVNKSGYPVVTVRQSKSEFNLTQERFFLVKPVKQDTTQWYIPITYVKEEAPNDVKSLWMIPGQNTTFSINASNWILFNKNQTGYYRVNYDVANWERLAKYLNTNNFKNISSTNRAQLIDDALNLARAGYLSYNVSLQITNYLSRETDYIPWYAAVRAFDYLDVVLHGSKSYEKYHDFIARNIQAFVKAVNYTNPNGTHIIKLGKVLALDTACKYGLKDCKDFAEKELNEWLNDEKGEKQLPPDLKNGIICAGLRNGNAETWKKVAEKYKKNEEEQANILTGLGCASKEIANAFLNSTIGKDSITDIFSAMNTIAERNAEAFEILENFINEHDKEIHEADEDDTKLAALLNKLANKVTTEKQSVLLTLMVWMHLENLGKFTGHARVAENLVWINSYLAEVEEFIEKNDKKQDTNSATSFTLASFLMIIPILLARFN